MGNAPIGNEYQTNGAFTLPENETETEIDTDNKFTEPNGNLSLCSVKTSTQTYTTHLFICFGIGLFWAV